MRFQDNELRLASRAGGDGGLRSVLSVPGMHCGGCIQKIEQGLLKLGGVTQARVNLSTKRVTIDWQEAGDTPALIDTLESLGFEAHIFRAAETETDERLKYLLRALAVSAFAAGNIMMLSIAVWSGSHESLRSALHWVSAFIACPALIYAGRVFFVPAFLALKNRQTNMDVPISVGLILTFAMSMFDTIAGKEHVYFDASVSLLFFLLIGRTLDHIMRKRASQAMNGLQKLIPQSACLVDIDETVRFIPLEDVKPSMRLRVLAGDRIPVDGIVRSGVSDIDMSLVTGESLPIKAQAGTQLVASALNLTGPLVIEASATADSSFLSELIRLMEQTEASQNVYRRLSDRVVKIYTPFVHGAALAAFCLWLFFSQDVHQALTIAVSVLIITCPCALGLAVPIVQVMAARRLLDAGVLMKEGGALERLKEVDTVVFDKTGSLTLGQPAISNAKAVSADAMAYACALAQNSHHPYSQAIAKAGKAQGYYAASSELTFDNVKEVPGCGVEGVLGQDIYRLGALNWAAVQDGALPDKMVGTALSRNGVLMHIFEFDDALKPGAKALMQALSAGGYDIHILSGDARDKVETIARNLGVKTYASQVKPEGKLSYILDLKAAGKTVLMVGDGLNDVPALSAANVSIAPENAVDIGRNAADFVLLRRDLMSIETALNIAKRSDSLMRQNIYLALLYNIFAVPLAFMGLVTPILAALAMSSSSLIVVINALRLKRGHS